MFQRVLIAVASEPIAAFAADAGIEMARKLGAEIAFITVKAGVAKLRRKVAGDIQQ